MFRFQKRRLVHGGSVVVASGLATAVTVFLAGCGGGGDTQISAIPTPIPSATASASPSPTPTPSVSAYSVVFSAPPSGNDQANENPTPSQDVTTTGTIIGSINAPTLITFQASHGSGANKGDYSLQFYLTETGGIQVGHVYPLSSLDMITYKETQSDGQIRQFFGNSFGGGTYTVVSISGNTVHLKGTALMVGSGTGGGTGYFTLAFDITVTLTSD